MAIAPDICKQIKEQISTKCVTVNAFGIPYGKDNIHQVTLMHSDRDVSPLPVRSDGIIVSNHMEKLCAIDVSLEGILGVEGVVDPGSQIISLRKELWTKIGIPIRSDHIMIMESANMTKDETMGLLQDLKLVIGGYEFYVQVQVVENAPYDLLLGLPFYTLTEANLKHFANGNADLTLKDPNTGAIITLPTRERIIEKENREVGF
jgi:hypothetical protein